MSELNKSDYQNMMPDYQSDEDRFYYENIMLRVGFGRRFAAWLIDGISVGVLGMILVMIMNSTGYLAKNGISLNDFTQLDFMKNQSLIEDFSLLIAPYTTIISLLYYSVEIFLGASLGKILLNIKIASQTRYEADMKTLLLRYSIKHINTILSIFAIITSLTFISSIGGIFGIIVFVGCFVVLGQNKMALHDYIAKTAVFYKDDIAPIEYTYEDNLN